MSRPFVLLPGLLALALAATGCGTSSDRDQARDAAPAYTATRSAVRPARSLVRLAGGDTVFSSDTRQGWRVDALGCRPEGPYDCEAES